MSHAGMIYFVICSLVSKFHDTNHVMNYIMRNVFIHFRKMPIKGTLEFRRESLKSDSMPCGPNN